MDLDTVAAHLEIQQVLFRYCRGVDRGEVELLKSVYHPDAMDDHGVFKGNGQAFAEHIVRSLDGAERVAQHHITNMLIEVRGSTAHTESYFLAWHPAPVSKAANHPGQEEWAIVGGRYLDRLERRNGMWKIAERRVVIDTSRAPQAPTPWIVSGTFAEGGRRERDPSGGFVGLVNQPKPMAAST